MIDFKVIYNFDDNLDSHAIFTSQEGIKNLTHSSVLSIVGFAPQIRVEGKIDPNPACILLPFAEKYQEVYEVKFDIALQKVDSGS
jgi:hypothetical protein